MGVLVLLVLLVLPSFCPVSLLKKVGVQHPLLLGSLRKSWINPGHPLFGSLRMGRKPWVSSFSILWLFE